MILTIYIIHKLCEKRFYLFNTQPDSTGQLLRCSEKIVKRKRRTITVCINVSLFVSKKKKRWTLTVWWISGSLKLLKFLFCNSTTVNIDVREGVDNLTKYKIRYLLWIVQLFISHDDRWIILQNTISLVDCWLWVSFPQTLCKSLAIPHSAIPR